MKKLIALITALLLIACLGVTVFAEDAPANTEITTTETESPGTEESPGTVEDPGAEDPGTQPFSEWLVEMINAYIAEILTFIVGIISFLVLRIQKKHIKPDQDAFIETTTSTLSQFVNDEMEKTTALKASVTENAESLGKNVGELGAELMKVITTVNSVIETVKDLQEQQSTAEKDRAVAEKDRAVLESVLETQEDMLNTIIQSSTLAQWKKDEIGLTHQKNMALIAGMIDAPKAEDAEGGGSDE